MLLLGLQLLSRTDRDVTCAVCALIAELVREREIDRARDALSKALWTQCGFVVMDALLCVRTACCVCLSVAV